MLKTSQVTGIARRSFCRSRFGVPPSQNFRVPPLLKQGAVDYITTFPELRCELQAENKGRKWLQGEHDRGAEGGEEQNRSANWKEPRKIRGKKRWREMTL